MHLRTIRVVLSRAVTSSDRSLLGRTTLVTGASRGIGRAIAVAFAGAGARLALLGRDLEALHETRVACGGDAVVLVCDLTDEAACAGAVAQAQGELGHLDCVVNNAGAARSRKFLDTDTALVRSMMTINFEAPLWLTRAALPAMLERCSGSIIFVASLSARVGYPYVAAYTASKHAELGLMRCLAAEHARSGVTFNAVCPHYVDTPMTSETIANIVARTGRSQREAERALLTPQGRLVRPEEVAAACLLFASPGGAGITGQAVNVDGGQVQS